MRYPTLSWTIKKNCVYLNIEKCSVTTDSRRITQINYQYSEVLERVGTIREHGVTFDSRLTFMCMFRVFLQNRVMSMASHLGVLDFFLKYFMYALFSLIRSRLE